MRVDLPQDLQLKILDLLPANERARLEATCKTWRELSMRSWTSVQLHCTAEEGFQAFADWLDLLAERQPGLLHAMQLHAAEVSVFVPGHLFLHLPAANLLLATMHKTLFLHTVHHFAFSLRDHASKKGFESRGRLRRKACLEGNHCFCLTPPA